MPSEEDAVSLPSPVRAPEIVEAAPPETDRLLEALRPLLEKRAGDRDFSRLGSIRFEGDPLGESAETR